MPHPSSPCRPRASAATTRAFTLVETLVVILVMGLVAMLVLASMAGSRQSAESTVCLTQVRNIALALRQYAVNNQYLPDPVAAGASWEQSVLRYLTTSGFVCPADQEVSILTGSSYDWRDTGEPLTTMAGRRVDDSTRRSAVLVFESLPDWHEKGKINAGWLDGSAHIMDDGDCFKDLMTPVRTAP